MATATNALNLISYLQDAHAMEQNVLRMLDSMIAQTSDREILTQLRIHRQQTERQERLLRERLQALGSGPSLLTDMPAIAGAWLKGLLDMVRSDKPGKMARDAYITEHVEIAAYALLERLAERAGDLETTRLARDLGAEERDMAQWIENHWDRFVDLTLEQNHQRSVWDQGANPEASRGPSSRITLGREAPDRGMFGSGIMSGASAGEAIQDRVRHAAQCAMHRLLGGRAQGKALTTLACVAGLGAIGYAICQMAASRHA